MRLTVNIKKKDPRFKGDQPSWNIVVSGAAELFNRGLERMLYLHGLTQMNADGEARIIWSSRPVIGSPPIYLAAMLHRKHRAVLKEDTAKMVNAAVFERPQEDGLEHLIGGPKAITAGRSALRVHAGSLDFIANCDADDEARIMFLEGAGWLPIAPVTERIETAFGSRPYRTRDPFLASNLEVFMNDQAKQRLGGVMGSARRLIELSRSQMAPENFSVPVPEGLDYLDFQKGGILRVVESGKSAIIADEMGLGKTIQGIGIFNAKPDMKSAIVFCQANMRLKWVREIEKWKVNPDLSVGHAEGSTWPDTDIVVINYDIVTRHLENIRGCKWDVALADEAHNLKNEEAQRTKAILGDIMAVGNGYMLPLSEGGQMVHLTGTPKPNRISELWPLLTSTRPDLWGKGPEARQAFLNRYEPPILIKKKFVKRGKEFERIIPMAGKPIRELELQLRLRGSGSFIRRLKRETDLPPKFRTPIEMPFRLSKEERDILREAEANLTAIMERVADSKLKSGERLEAGAIIDVIRGLSPDSPGFQEIARVRRNLGLVKAPHAARFIIEELKEEEDLAPELRRKTVVFAHHKDVIATIAGLAEEAFPGGVLVYDGSVQNIRRQERIDRFQEDPTSRLFIMSLAGATGITLTASNRMRVIEPDWSPSNMVQIEDRIWRIGQEKSCDIGYLFVPESLDVKMGMSLIEKMETDERAINTFGFSGMKRRDRRSGIEESVVQADGEAVMPPSRFDERQSQMNL